MPDPPAQSRVIVFMFTDIVGSSALKARLGTADYAALLRQHNDAFRRVLADARGTELENPGDGFLTRFETASAAIDTALRFQHALASGPWEGERLAVRIGVHMGEVLELDQATSNAEKFVGTPIDMAARVESLALPRQVLMTRAIFDDARQYVRDHPPVEGGDPPELQWMAHGPYLFKGNDEPLEVFEVGAVGVAPLREPPDSAKARRAVTPGEEEMLGWRPARGREIPGRKGWVLGKKLGEGGFGEVWLAWQEKTGTRRVFKFCFDADRLRSFKRELTLFRLLRSALGDRPDIAKIHDIQLDRPPFHLESELTEQGDLADWAEAQGGIDRVPLATRLDLMRRIAVATAAAHSVGILHKDLKPSNVLIDDGESGPRPRLTDFGIGALIDPQQLKRHDITATGFTETLLGGNESSRTGTRIYAPPESLVGEVFTIEGDVYAIGVMLYQMVVGDLRRPLGQGWEHDVDDPLLREDIAACVAGRREDRLGSAGALAERLETLGARRRARRRRVVSRAAVGATVVLAVLLAITAGLIVRERGLRRQIAEERDEARRQTAIAEAINAFLREDLLSSVSPYEDGRHVTVREVLDAASRNIEGRFEDQPVVEAALRETIAVTYYGVGEYAAAASHIEAAVAMRRALHGDDHPDTLSALNRQAELLVLRGEYREGEAAFRAVLEARRAALGPDHPDTLDTLNNLGTTLNRMSRYEEARPLLEDALARRRRVLGDDHPRTIGSLADVGFTHYGTADYDEAEPYWEEALAVRRRRLGENHPETLLAMSNLGYLRREQGDYAEAAAMHTETLARRREIFGDEHPTTLESMNSLADMYDRLGRYEESEQLGREALEIRRRALGDEHPHTLNSMNNLANQYARRGRFDQAEPLYRHTLETRRRVLGQENPETLTSMNNVALFYKRLGRLDEAEKLYLETLETRRRVTGPEHPKTVVVMSNLANVYRSQARYEEAVALLEAALDIRRRTLGAEHPQTIRMMSSLASAYSDAGRTDEAERLYRESLAKKRAIQGDQHPSTLVTIGNLATLYAKMGRLAEAEPLFLEAVTGERKVLADDDVSRASALREYGKCLRRLERYEDAQAALLEALGLYVAAYGDDDARTVALRDDIADVYDAWPASGM